MDDVFKHIWPLIHADTAEVAQLQTDRASAKARYEEAGPSNRLVAGTLEKRWNDAMQRLLDLQAELANFERQIMRLGKDFPRLWNASTTTSCDR
jgi:hypothetical protein